MLPVVVEVYLIVHTPPDTAVVNVIPGSVPFVLDVSLTAALPLNTLNNKVPVLAEFVPRVII